MMSFWVYMLHCKGGAFYTGHTDDLDRRMAEHEAGAIPGFVSDHWPAKLVWSQEFSTRLEAIETERRIKGWSRAKKLALIRQDWDKVSALAKKKGSRRPSVAFGSTGSGRTERMANPRSSAQLACHPDTQQSAIASIRVDINRRAGGYLLLSFRAVGSMEQVVWPSLVASADGPWTRADRLWEHGCFEAFGSIPGESGYFELNLATSGRWAAYAFYDYRVGMRPAEDMLLVSGNWKIGPKRVELHASLDVPPAYQDKDWLFGLSAVIEATDGTKSYWALAHPPGKPDFHHPDCFVLELPAAGGR
jgi:predicted GIY-YIG superfamily endonuclease